MAIDYERVNWGTTSYVNPQNMNQMDKGIEDACNGVDNLNASVDERIGDMSTLPYPDDDLSSNITAINSTLLYGGKNLWTLDKTLIPTAATNIYTKAPIELPSGTYTFSYDASTTSDINNTIVLYSDSGEELVQFNVSNAERVHTFTVNDKVKSITWYTRNANTYSNIQIEKGSTKTDYEEHYDGLVGLNSTLSFKKATLNTSAYVSNFGDFEMYYNDIDTVKSHGYIVVDTNIPTWRTVFTTNITLNNDTNALFIDAFSGAAFPTMFNKNGTMASASKAIPAGSYFVYVD